MLQHNVVYVATEEIASALTSAEIEVRGFPNAVFDPWARWIRGLALARNSSGAAAVAVAL